MSCDHELANEWAHCSGKNASYITNFVIIIVSGTDLTINFIDEPLSWAFGISLRTVNNPFLIWCYTHRDAPFVFNIWWLLCSLFVQHGCLLFFKFTLASGVLLVQEFSVSIIHVARFLHVGKTFAKKFQESTGTELLYLHGWLAIKDRWMVSEKNT